MSLKALESQLLRDLKRVEYPALPWLHVNPQAAYDVIIVGGGMVGLTSAFALMRNGITNIHVYDNSPKGYEGPWATCARMRTLRSQKDLQGPALNIPSLTFEAWYVTQHGKESWDALYKIPTEQWMDYLRWYREVLSIPATNDKAVSLIEPKDDVLAIHFEGEAPITCQKVVLATGRAGFGGLRYPKWSKDIPKRFYAHTYETFDCSRLAHKSIIVVGAGASAFDAAAAALEAGATSVLMLARRPHIPNVNKFASATAQGWSEGYFLLSDADKLRVMTNAKKAGSPPPFESLDRVKVHPNFSVMLNTQIETARIDNEHVALITKHDTYHCDFVFLATGFETDVHKQPEIQPFADKIALWGDRIDSTPDAFKAFPYLGRHFQFLEKVPGTAPYLKNIYCYNNAAKVSHGIISSDIPNITTGALRLANGITADFFSKEPSPYVTDFEHYDKADFNEKDYLFIKQTK